MNISEITLTRGITINTGNYNSVRIDVQATFVLEQNRDDLTQVVEAHNWLVDEVERELFDSGIDHKIVLAHVSQLRKAK